jgi:hypothetical protein
MTTTQEWMDRITNYGKESTTHKQSWKSWEDFNKKIGLPKHPAAPYTIMPLMEYQNEFFHTIDNSKHYHKFYINKARQMGFSELILRIVAYRSDNKYRGQKIKIIAGTRSSATIKLMDRLKDLFRNYPEQIENNSDKLYLELRNGTSYEGLPANPEALTGDTKIRCIVMDEAAKWDLKDDLPVLNSIMPIVDTNKSDLFVFSTPKGKRGFFYKLELAENDFMKLKYDIWRTKGYLYSEEEIKKFLADKTIDVDQEYLNQYTAGSANIFGTVNIDPNLIAEDWDIWQEK